MLLGNTYLSLSSYYSPNYIFPGFITKGLKKAGTSKKADKKIEEDSKPVRNADKSSELQNIIIHLKIYPEIITTPTEDRPKTKGSNKASQKATEDVKEKGEFKAAGIAAASGEFPIFIMSLKVSYLDCHLINSRQAQSEG
jgi:hypothetical protein